VLIKLSIAALIGLAVVVLGLLGLRLFQPEPRALGLTAAGRLADLDAKPNWVSSDSELPDHAIAALPAATPDRWQAARAAALALPRTSIASESDNYLYLECRSLLFRYVDDLELHYRPDTGTVAVRSASRAGHGDMGVNRRRVETLRTALEAQP
jgi:uncharacterized protein (DUF1499 family)